MALLRRCARLLCIQRRFIKIREKSGGSFSNESYGGGRDYVYRFRILARPNSHHASNPDAERSRNFKFRTTVENEIPEKSGMRYAEIKEILSTKNVKLSSDSSAVLRVLKNCRDMYPDATIQQRHDLVRETWDFLEKLGQPLSTEHYNILLVIHAQNSCYLNVDEFLRRMKATPDLDTYRLLLEAMAEIGDCAQALTIMAKIEEMGYPIDEAMFNSLLLAYSVGADIEGAQDIVTRMEANKIESSPATYCALSRGFAVKGDLQSLRRVLKSSNLDTKQLMAVVKTLSLSGHGEHLAKVMEHLPETVNIETNEVARVIVELMYSGKARDAFRVIDHLSAQNEVLESLANSNDFYLYEIIKSDTPMEEILAICKSFIPSGKESYVLLKLTEAALRLKREDKALLTFQALRNHGIEIRPHFYWPLLINAALNKLESDVIRLVKHMINEKVDPDYETLRDYVIPFLSASDPVIIVRKLQDCGIKISELLTPVLTFLLDNGDLIKAVALTDKIKGKTDVEIVIEHLLSAYQVTRNVDATTKFLKNINFNSDQIEKFLFDLLTARRVIVSNVELAPLVSAFKQNRIKISRQAAAVLKLRIMRLPESKDLLETIEKLIDHKMSSVSEETYGWIPHPRVMTAEQLENHLIDLKAQGMNTRGVLRRLLQVHCSKNNLKKAEEFGKMFTKNGFEWTAGMISNMFSLYAANDILDEADIRYRELRSKHANFKIDDFKIIDYATALVKRDRLGRALEVLNEQKYVKTSPEIIRNCWKLLNAVAATGNPESTKRTLDLLLQKRYCEVSNHVLAPLIKTYLINGDIKAAVSQFKECATIYKKTPLRQELIRTLLDASIHTPEAHKQISEVLYMIKRIHGDAAADTHMCIALTVKNRQEELRKLLTMPRMNQTTLTTVAQKLADENNTDALQMILKTCGGINKLDTTIIYKLIMTVCSRCNDHKTALQIWEKMRTEEMIPSPEFIEDLKILLKSQKILLPLELQSVIKETDS